MKIYLASFYEQKNHGPGRKISVVKSPKGQKVDGVLEYLSPSENIIEGYKNLQQSDQKLAAEFFVSSYKEQLDNFIDELRKTAEEERSTMMEQLPLKNGDTLLSWERHEYTNYRSILAEYLMDIGYEVISK
jgi:uncharacterized protein YeaO (DUF488 family)